ncbi:MULTISPECIES: CRISPR-associated helicase Cas3' [unclassified Marinobacter]|uniref:CRISPR-associated helicase Cas3' n=1 Tax=unclassified Marinobacter TaxID=83889 RepID=UPI000C384A34|nr:CRISPR-associated helicase Cas3' [Marinobacter sp.]MAO11748.1 CRISPR-associated helicase/endonuclease Cas3 [Marinobacter sp.]
MTGMNNLGYVAHVKQDDYAGDWHEPHRLEEHLRKVAKLSASKAGTFQSSGWGMAAGLWHDLGKYRGAFQKYIRDASGYERENAHVESPQRVTHSTAGAVHAINQWPSVPGYVTAYLIAGHHAGLPDWSGGRGSLQFRLRESGPEYSEAMEAAIPKDLLTAHQPDIPEPARNTDSIGLWMRLLFSCLVDADFLDTESYMAPERVNQRGRLPRLPDLHSVFFERMNELQKAAEDTPLNRTRKSIFDACQRSAAESPGIFSLTVPTGGGKTLASLGFALEHARKHGKSRVIYAIPFTSIIEQNAGVFRQVLGEEAVLEHHSSLDVDPSLESAGSRLAAENWDAPLIVTTNVQLFESLFASRTSRCRKLHNLVNSIVVLDEAQQIPRDFHEPITRVMRQMSEHFGVTWVLCTATQPDLGKQVDAFGSVLHTGLGNIREIIQKPAALASQLKRVSIEMPSDPDEKLSWEGLSHQLAEEDCVLVVVNKRQDARTLYELLPQNGDTYHLSANMCAEHRSQVLAEIRHKLSERKTGSDRPLRVVSTQLIEAGVDVDFPVVYRAIAGLDSIAQAAGRCNREGRLPNNGRVVVFQPEQLPPPGFLRQAAQVTLKLLRSGQLNDPLSPQAIQAFFSDLNTQGDRDKHGICRLLKAESSSDAPLAIQFRAAAEKFRLIDDKGVGVVVPFRPEGAEEPPVDQWLSMLEQDGSQKWVHRKLQRYSVTLPESLAKQLHGMGAIYERAGKFVVESSHYHPVWGVQAPDSLIPAESTVI